MQEITFPDQIHFVHVNLYRKLNTKRLEKKKKGEEGRRGEENPSVLNWGEISKSTEFESGMFMGSFHGSFHGFNQWIPFWSLYPQ